MSCLLTHWSLAMQIYIDKLGLLDGLVQDCSNSSALAVELLQPCTEPLIFGTSNEWMYCHLFCAKSSPKCGWPKSRSSSEIRITHNPYISIVVENISAQDSELNASEINKQYALHWSTSNVLSYKSLSYQVILIQVIIVLSCRFW